VLRDVVVYPGIELEAIERDALFTDRDFGKAGTYLGVESISIHAEVGRRVPQPQHARQQDNVAGSAGLHAGATTRESDLPRAGSASPSEAAHWLRRPQEPLRVGA